ncbi:hypothetical protein IX38_09890 [Chryseobacterium luteum]|uniref:RNA polymerase sigma factor n=2 Tax=Chryseobacterium luteum TaxID=421531 RepID=A0A085ZH10_9FLAO|nr:hypothetical protein IX38_09890 [Chryseobacterium luteum]
MENTDWNHIYTQLSPKLLGICRRYIADLQTAEDLLQDSFIIAMQKNHQLKDKKALFGWLKTIIVNNALQHLRKHSKEIFVSTEISEIPEPLNEMNTSSMENNHVLAYDFTTEELLNSIDSLPSHHRSVFNLFFIEKNSHAEIANLLGINVNTSKSHLLRAKKSIQNYLLTTVVNQSKPKNKNKITQLLIFLGLGSLLWAQTFKKTFSDFSIEPSNSFEIPQHIQVKNINFQSSSGFSWKTKIIATSSIFVIILSSVMIFQPSNQSRPSNTNTKAQSIKKVTGKEEIRNQIPNKTIKNINTGPTINKETTKNNIAEKAIDIEENTSRITKNKQNISIKDSVRDVPKKIIVVKKIIQRDTIYVER